MTFDTTVHYGPNEPGYRNTGDNMTTFATALQLSREQAGLTKSELARQLTELGAGTTTPGHIYEWERGSKLPSAERIIVIAGLLDTDPVPLIALAGKVHPVVETKLHDPAFAANVYSLATNRYEEN